MNGIKKKLQCLQWSHGRLVEELDLRSRTDDRYCSPSASLIGCWLRGTRRIADKHMFGLENWLDGVALGDEVEDEEEEEEEEEDDAGEEDNRRPKRRREEAEEAEEAEGDEEDEEDEGDEEDEEDRRRLKSVTVRRSGAHR